MRDVISYAATHASIDLRPMLIPRREPAPNEVQIDILYCGICHSDVHQVLNEWKNTLYPCVPGHEIVGRVTAVGSDVRKIHVDEIVGVGCMVDSCHRCKNCLDGLEQYCEEGFLATYNGNARNPSDANQTYGGYSQSIVVREDFVLHIPAGIEPAYAAPIMCAGVTTYSALRHWNAGPGMHVGVVGLGGLGHMAIKLAVALGANVTAITHSKEKKHRALENGARNVIVSSDKMEMKGAEGSFDLILSTIPSPHDPNVYMNLLRTDGVYTVIGCLLPLKKPVDMSKAVFDRKTLASTLIGGISETQDVLDFCALKNVLPDVRVITIDEVNQAFKQVDKGEIDFRYVIDMKTLNGHVDNQALRAKVGL